MLFRSVIDPAGGGGGSEPPGCFWVLLRESARGELPSSADVARAASAGGAVFAATCYDEVAGLTNEPKLPPGSAAATTTTAVAAAGTKRAADGGERGEAAKGAWGGLTAFLRQQLPAWAGGGGAAKRPRI